MSRRPPVVLKMGDQDYVSKSGWVVKLGYERPSWRKRFFVLDRNVVSYYGTETDYQKKKTPKGVFSLDVLSRPKIKAVETGTILVNSNALKSRDQKVALKKPYLIQIGDCAWQESGLRTFYVSCTTQEERSRWIDAFLHNCNTFNASSEGKQMLARLPQSQGERREAYEALLRENKRQQEKAKEEQESRSQAAKHKAMRQEPWYQVHTLCSKGTVEQLAEEVEKGLDPELLNPNGGSTLLQAATYGNVSVMRWLIERGLDVNQASKGGNTPLHAAACMGFPEAAEVLLAAGASRDLMNKEGKTAAQAAKTDSLRDLIEKWDGGSASSEAQQAEADA